MEAYGNNTGELYDASPEELYRQFSEASILPHEQGLATLNLISQELVERNRGDIEDSLAFISLMETSPSAYNNNSALVWGGIATRFALRVRQVNREAGIQKAHTLLTHQNSSFRLGSWTEVGRWNDRCRIPYDDYHLLFATHTLMQRTAGRS